jgi:hypothetical protein
MSDAFVNANLANTDLEQRAPNASSKRALQAQWENAQCVPVLILLLLAIGCGVLSQVGNGDGPSAPIGVAGFAFFAFLALKRIDQTYKSTFVGALVERGVSHADARACFDTRYPD